MRKPKASQSQIDWVRSQPVPQGGPTESLCEFCPKVGSWGVTWPASSVNRWFCREHRPAEFFRWCR